MLRSDMLSDHLCNAVVAQIARSAGGVSQLADVLQQVKELCLSCNGPAECGQMLRVAQDVVSAAGGAKEVYKRSVNTVKHSLCSIHKALSLHV